MKEHESTHPAAHSAGAHPPAEEDRIHSKTIVFVGVAALCVFVVASVVTITWMKRRQAELAPEGPPPLPAELGQSKIGMLEQRLFENSNQAQVMTRVQRQKLEQYGWVDRERGVVRIPIGEAMERVVAGERPQPSPGYETSREVRTGGGGPGSQPSQQPGAARPGEVPGAPREAPPQRSPLGGTRR
jgi:hypothetical protein